MMLNHQEKNQYAQLRYQIGKRMKEEKKKE